MFFPFLPASEVDSILEEHHLSEMQRGEIEAETGSSYFYGGCSPADASLLAAQEMAELEARFAATPEGERYFARLEVAQFMARAVTEDMRMRLADEGSVYDFHTVVPEYYPYDVTGAPVTDPDLAVFGSDDIPF